MWDKPTWAYGETIAERLQLFWEFHPYLTIAIIAFLALVAFEQICEDFRSQRAKDWLRSDSDRDISETTDPSGLD